ncbi:MAG: hypothetical protein M1820_010487 [Bogoriella megaspora]|nr:MAG: hypothetical protein M1820_010487 [Bogoriella megaspora]
MAYRDEVENLIKEVDTPKPLAELTIPKASALVECCLQTEVRRKPQTPITPITPITVEALTSCYNLIKQDASALDELSEQRPQGVEYKKLANIQRLREFLLVLFSTQGHVQKLASAAQISFAEHVLLHNQKQLLSKANNESKVRRSIRSVVLGKAKLMSYQDFEEACERQGVRARD